MYPETGITETCVRDICNFDITQRMQPKYVAMTHKQRTCDTEQTNLSDNNNS